MIELTKDNFLQVMADKPMVLVVFTDVPQENDEATFTALFNSLAGPAAWHRARVNAISSPDIASMFGISDQLPTLMIMREQIVLYCESIDTTSSDETRNIIDRAAALDMESVRRDIAEEQSNQAWLFERRVCPTARRLRSRAPQIGDSTEE